MVFYVLNNTEKCENEKIPKRKNEDSLVEFHITNKLTPPSLPSATYYRSETNDKKKKKKKPIHIYSQY